MTTYLRGDLAIYMIAERLAKAFPNTDLGDIPEADRSRIELGVFDEFHEDYMLRSADEMRHLAQIAAEGD
jgi:hypothetical protein